MEVRSLKSTGLLIDTNISDSTPFIAWISRIITKQFTEEVTVIHIICYLSDGGAEGFITLGFISGKGHMPYYWGDQIKKNEMGEECSTFRGEERCVQGLVGKPERMRPLGRPRRRWKYNI
jgi:hypothetical protein